jgi:HAD superfamily hydrolase (TIGR01459 family)
LALDLARGLWCIDRCMTAAARTSISALIERYQVFFLDAYGVLVASNGALPGAAGFLARLADAGRQVLILSNDASRSVDTSLARYRGFGLPLAREQILTSGMLLTDHYAQAGLHGAPTIVLGTRDSEAYVREAGGVVVAPSDEAATVVVVADDDGYDFLETVNDVITVLFHRLDRGLPTHLVLPNPDLLFPRGPGAYGVTSGAIALMIEGALRLRDPSGALAFTPLGKPHRPIFAAGLARAGVPDARQIVMVGDQLVTDIRGAADFGLDSVFVETGVGRLSEAAAHGVLPTWVVASVAVE